MTEATLGVAAMWGLFALGLVLGLAVGVAAALGVAWAFGRAADAIASREPPLRG